MNKTNCVNSKWPSAMLIFQRHVNKDKSKTKMVLNEVIIQSKGNDFEKAVIHNGSTFRFVSINTRGPMSNTHKHYSLQLHEHIAA